MLSFECIKNEKSVYFLLTSAYNSVIGHITHDHGSGTHREKNYWVYGVIPRLSAHQP